jgi:anti-anti-sigma factor
MHFTIEQEDATTIFRLKEPRLDSLNASALKAEFLILAQPDVETLIVDLSEVQQVDSAGLSALLLAERQQAAHGGEVRLVGANDNLKSLLSLTQLDRVFATYDTLDQALDHEPSFGDDDDDDSSAELPGAPTKAAIRAGAISAGGSLGAAQLTNIMMGSPENSLRAAVMDDDEDYDDEEFDDDDELDEVDLIEDEAAGEKPEEDAAGEAEEEDLDEDLDDVDDEFGEDDLDELDELEEDDLEDDESDADEEAY